MNYFSPLHPKKSPWKVKLTELKIENNLPDTFILGGNHPFIFQAVPLPRKTKKKHQTGSKIYWITFNLPEPSTRIPPLPAFSSASSHVATALLPPAGAMPTRPCAAAATAAVPLRPGRPGGGQTRMSGRKFGSMVRTHGLFHLLINRVYWMFQQVRISG